jgi:hypothetical protein
VAAAARCPTGRPAPPLLSLCRLRPSPPSFRMAGAVTGTESLKHVRALQFTTMLLGKDYGVGKMVFGSILPRTASDLQRKFCNGDLMQTPMLLELCEFCCAGTAKPSGVSLRCRKCGWMTFCAEGMEEPEAPRAGCASARGWRRSGRDVPKIPTRPEQDRGLFRCRRCGAL